MRLKEVNKELFFSEVNKNENIPISYNKNIDKFMYLNDFKIRYFFVIKIKNIVGFLPVCKKKSLNFSIPYFSYGLYYLEEINDEVIKQLDFLIKSKFKNFYIRLFSYVSDFNNNYKVSTILNLEKNSELQLQSFKSKLRSQIKKSLRNGLVVDFGITENHIKIFYNIYSKHMHALGSPSYSLSFFQNFINSFNTDSLIFIVYYNNIPISTSLCLINGKSIEVVLASSIRKYNYLSSNMCLYWEMIKYANSKKLNYFSFGRSNYNSTQFKFKSQWSQNHVHILKLSSKTLFDLKFLKSIFGRIYNKLPYKFINKIGSYIAEKIY